MAKSGSITPPTHVEIGQVHENLSPDVVQITTDRLELILHQHARAIEKRKSWVAPLGVFIALTLALLTSNFDEFLFSAETWRAIFVVSNILSFFWLCKESIESLRSKSIQDLVDAIKG